MRKKIIAIMVGIFIIISSFSIRIILINNNDNNISGLPEPIIASDDIMVVQYWVYNSTFLFLHLKSSLI